MEDTKLPTTKPAAASPLAVPSTVKSNKSSISSHPNNNNVSSQYVDHTYTDYADVCEAEVHSLIKREQAAQTSNIGKNGVDVAFPGKLLEVLDRGDLTDIITWLPHGRAFLVRQSKLFTSQVLPRFFRQTKFLSFTRQLNLWGYKRITRGTDAGAYYHELFLPGRPNLALRMKRLKIKGTGIRPILNPAGEPKFYRDYKFVELMPRTKVPLPPLPNERIASLMGNTTNGGRDGENNISSVSQHPGGVAAATASGVQGLGHLTTGAAAFAHQQGFMSHHQGMMNTLGNANYSAHAPRSGLSPSLVAAAEMRLRGMVDPRVEVVPSIMTGLPAENNKHPYSSLDNSALEVLSSMSSCRKSPKSLFLDRAAATPRDATSADRQQDDANRRLMERLELLQGASASAAAMIPGSVRDSAQGAFRPISFEQKQKQQQAKEHQLSELDLLQRKVMMQARCGRASMQGAVSSSSASTPALASLYGTTASQEQFLGSAYHRSSSLPSSLPTRGGGSMVDIHVVTNALQDAQRLEELAQSQRAIARAMARDMVQQGAAGYDDILPFGRFGGGSTR